MSTKRRASGVWQSSVRFGSRWRRKGDYLLSNYEKQLSKMKKQLSKNENTYQDLTITVKSGYNISEYSNASEAPFYRLRAI